MDDSRDEENILAMAKTMATTERLAAETRRQLRAEKQKMLTRRQVSHAIGYVPANSKRFGGAPYAASVGPTHLAIGGGHGINSGSVREEESDSARGPGARIVSRSASPSPASMSGRQII